MRFLSERVEELDVYELYDMNIFVYKADIVCYHLGASFIHCNVVTSSSLATGINLTLRLKPP